MERDFPLTFPNFIGFMNIPCPTKGLTTGVHPLHYVLYTMILSQMIAKDTLGGPAGAQVLAMPLWNVNAPHNLDFIPPSRPHGSLGVSVSPSCS
jgi:hypothetical protein